MFPDIDWAMLPADEVCDTAAMEISSLSFRPCRLFEIYWLACLVSDYCVSDPTTFSKIVAPNYLQPVYEPLVPLDKSIMGKRAYPPKIYSESEAMLLDLSQLQREIEGMGRHHPSLLAECTILPSKHEFREVLRGYRGRPKTSHKRGRPPKRSDRKAVYCAKMINEGRTNTEISRKVGLPRKMFDNYWQSNASRYLVKRGQLLIESLNCHFSRY